jgi:hypothetical protein
MELQIVTRQEALDKKLDKYFTGQPCKYNHIAERFTRNGGCSDCHKEQSAASRRNISVGELREEHKATAKSGLVRRSPAGASPNTILRNVIDQYIVNHEESLFGIVEKVVEQARSGCRPSQKLMLDRIWKDGSTSSSQLNGPRGQLNIKIEVTPGRNTEEKVINVEQELETQEGEIIEE